jgi:hypothetical protein
LHICLTLSAGLSFFHLDLGMEPSLEDKVFLTSDICTLYPVGYIKQFTTLIIILYGVLNLENQSW